MLHKNASITSIPRRRYRPPCSRVRVRIRVRVEVRFSVSASSIDLHDNDRGSETGAKRRALPFFLGEDLIGQVTAGNRKSGKIEKSLITMRVLRLATLFMIELPLMHINE